MDDEYRKRKNFNIYTYTYIYIYIYISAQPFLVLSTSHAQPQPQPHSCCTPHDYHDDNNTPPSQKSSLCRYPRGCTCFVGGTLTAHALTSRCAYLRVWKLFIFVIFIIFLWILAASMCCSSERILVTLSHMIYAVGIHSAYSQF